MLIQTNRRTFLKNIGLATAGTLVAPSFLSANNPMVFEGKRLVVIQLSGGNDGLNTIIPYKNDELHRLRPDLIPNSHDLLKLTDEIAFNPVMSGLKSMYDDGDLCLLNGVGYPNSNRSHFRSMDIWQSGSNPTEYLNTGWVGRYLDSQCTPEQQIKSIEMGSVLSLAMKGKLYKGTPVENIEAFYKASRQVPADHFIGENEAANFLYKTIAETKGAASYLKEKAGLYTSKEDFPQGAFGKHLKEVAEMIVSGVEAPVYYVSLGGFDTHSFQKGRQEKLLKTYSDGLKSLSNELKRSGLWKDTLVMTFSEFGRRVSQNASRGTDHGKANCLILAGGGLKKQGLYNDVPSLTDLDNGDLKFDIDFRQVYSTILNKWLDSNSDKILMNSFDSLHFV